MKLGKHRGARPRSEKDLLLTRAHEQMLTESRETKALQIRPNLRLFKSKHLMCLFTARRALRFLVTTLARKTSLQLCFRNAGWYTDEERQWSHLKDRFLDSL